MVSIRARHCWRAMRPKSPRATSLPTFQSAPAIAGGRCPGNRGRRGSPGRFNPRPPLLAGDASQRRVRQAARFVSIRARHCWRAMRCYKALPQCCLMFQSAPAIAGGRCPRWAPPSASSPSFNPRPPLLAGDAMCAAIMARNPLVSIRARHCWRAMRAGVVLGQQAVEVSIRARHCWRAMPARPPAARRWRPVSIRARHCWRAMPAARCALPILGRVSIRARHCWRAMPPDWPVGEAA